MVGMDSHLKGIILNCTLKSYSITPIERANVLKVTMSFYGGYKYKSPRKREGNRLSKEKFLAKFSRDPFMVPIPFLEPGQTPTPVAQDTPVCAAISTPFLPWAEETVCEMEMMCDKHNHLAQETEDAKKEKARMSEWVLDLKNLRADTERELCQVELDIRRKKRELSQLNARKKEWEASGLKSPVVTSSASGLSMGSAAKTRASKKKKNKQETP